MKNKLRRYIQATVEIIIATFLGFLIWNLGLFTFIGYVIAFFGALNKKLFLKKNKMAFKLFIGTILIYISGKLIPLIFNSWISGDMFGGFLMVLLAVYIWFKGEKIRKKGKS